MRISWNIPKLTWTDWKHFYCPPVSHTVSVILFSWCSLIQPSMGLVYLGRPNKITHWSQCHSKGGRWGWVGQPPPALKQRCSNRCCPGGTEHRKEPWAAHLVGARSGGRVVPAPECTSRQVWQRRAATAGFVLDAKLHCHGTDWRGTHLQQGRETSLKLSGWFLFFHGVTNRSVRI